MNAFKTGLVVGLGAGYVLGARAGRERYEQIARAARMAWDSQPGERMRAEVAKAMPDAVNTAVAKVGQIRHRNGGMPAARVPA